MKNALEAYLKEQKIEYYGVLSYSDCREIGKEIIERSGIVPRSVILYLVPYYVGDGENFSSYATSYDYHIILREIGEGIISLLKRYFPDSHSVAYGDHSPIDEKYAAASLGLGVIGLNKLLINEKYGSYVFIGDVVTDVDPEKLCAQGPVLPRGCVGCGKCLDACPTGILSGDESLGCLSAITQRKGELTDAEIALMRSVGTAWGCDECQRCCPHNKKIAVTGIEFFHRERITRLERDAVEEMDRSAFIKRAFSWRGKKTVLRNIDILEGGAACEGE
ncbi:MAG: epoxyqueuosine reductase [Clostridia bacterium]|nr:epoxyqueuosine reductase [Clostridia bacterium]